MTPLRLQDARWEDCLQWDAALRVGRPVVWDGPLPARWTAAEVGPLVVDGPELLRPWLPPDGACRLREDAVTVVIPSHVRVPWAMSALRAQTWPTAVLVVSNGDGPQHVKGARVWRTDWRGHARTRRDALEHVDTPLVLLMTDDAMPRGRGFVERMVAALRPGVDAVVARQVPWPTASLRVREQLRAWTPPTPGPMPHADHVATLYRTDDLRRFARADVPIAEDLAWTLDRSVVRAPDAVVLHSHIPDLRAVWHRRRAEHAVRAQLGVPVPIGGLRDALRALPGVMQSHGLRELPAGLAEVVAMGLGARAGRKVG